MVRGLSLLGLAAWLGLGVAGTPPLPGDKDVLPIREGNGQTWEINWYYTAEMCEIYLETMDGKNCKTRVTCKQGGTIRYHDFPNLYSGNCSVTARTTYHDPRIGEFMVIYTERDGLEGQGLTNPMIVLKSMPEPIDVSALALEHWKAGACRGTPAGNWNCDPGPFVCEWILESTSGLQRYDNIRLKRWHCGVPRDGRTWPKGMSWARLRPGSGWRPTWLMNENKCQWDANCRNWKKNPPLVRIPEWRKPEFGDWDDE